MGAGTSAGKIVGFVCWATRLVWRYQQRDITRAWPEKQLKIDQAVMPPLVADSGQRARRDGKGEVGLGAGTLASKMVGFVCWATRLVRRYQRRDVTRAWPEKRLKINQLRWVQLVKVSTFEARVKSIKSCREPGKIRVSWCLCGVCSSTRGWRDTK